MYHLGLTDYEPLRYIKRNYLLMLDIRHLWFLPALFWCLVSLNMLHKSIAAHKTATFFFLTAIHFAYPLIPEQYTVYFHLNDAMHYGIYLYIGYLISYTIQTGKASLSKKSLIVSSMIWITVLTFRLYSEVDIAPIEQATDFICAISGTIALFSLSKIAARHSWLTSSWFYKTVSANSFGIYLFHPMIIYLCFFYTSSMAIDPWILSSAILLVTLVLSTVFTILMRKIPYMRLALGEHLHPKAA